MQSVGTLTAMEVHGSDVFTAVRDLGDCPMTLSLNVRGP